MSARMYMADGRAFGLGSQPGISSPLPTGARAINVNTLKSATNEDSKYAKTTFVNALDRFNPHRWVGSGTLDSENVHYQNRVSRVVTKEIKGPTTTARRAQQNAEYDSFEDEEEEIYLREKDLALMAVGFLAFVKSWEAKLISDLERKEAGMDDDELDKSIWCNKNALSVKEKELQLRENMILAKEHKMLKQQLEYLQQQAAIQHEAFQMEQQIKYEQSVLSHLQERQTLLGLERSELSPPTTGLRASALKLAPKSISEEVESTRGEMEDLAKRGFLTRSSIPDATREAAVLRQQQLTENLQSMNASIKNTARSVQDDAGVKSTVQILTGLPWTESSGGHRVQFTFIPRNNHVLGKWKEGKLSCLVTDGGKGVQGAWSSNGAVGEFVLVMGSDGLSFRGFWLQDSVAAGFWAFRFVARLFRCITEYKKLEWVIDVAMP